MESIQEMLHLGDVFVCDECANVYTTREELDEHLKMHRSEDVVPEKSSANSNELELKEEKLDPCEVCGKTKPEQMSEQMIPVKTEKSSEELTNKDIQEPKPMFYVCAECKDLFKVERELNEHLKQHNSGEDVQERSVLDSTVCPTRTEMELKEEKPELCTQCNDCGKVKPKEKLFICADCRTVFTAEKELDEHQKTHNFGEVVQEKSVPNSTLCTVKTELELKEEKSELCKDCGKPKPKPKVYICSECKSDFPAEGELDKDFQIHDPGGNVPKSPEAVPKEVNEVSPQGESNKHFKTCSPGELIRETEMELKEEKEDLCTVCGKAFITTDVLKLHNEEKPHRCEICNQQKPKPKFFVCADCEAIFTVEEKLDEHLKTHRFEQNNSMSPQLGKSSSAEQPSPSEGHFVSLKGVDESPEMSSQADVEDLGRHETEDESPETPSDRDVVELGLDVMEDPEVDVTTVDIKPYLCDMCNEAFKNLKDFLHHEVALCPERSRTLTQTHNKLYVCDLCFEIFTDKNSLVSHKKQHGFADCEDTIMESVETDTKPYLCEVCHEAFTDTDSLTSHKEQHGILDSEDRMTERIEMDMKPYLCDMCNKAFKTLNDFLHHKVTLCPEASRTLTGTDTKPFLCDLCHEIFTDKDSLSSHKEEQHEFPRSEDPTTETDTNPHLCEMYHEAFSDENSLAYHKKQQHGFLSDAETDSKPETSDSSSTLHNILGSISFNSEGLFICVHCRNIFETEEALNHHLKTHPITTDDPDVTKVRSDQHESTSTIPVRIEETFQPDKCVTCQQLTDSSKLPKPQQCKLCDKSFTERRSFNIHMLIHRSKKRFLDRTTSTGHNCKNIFKAREALNNHLRIQSSTEVNADITPGKSDQHDTESTSITLERKTYQCKKCYKTFELKPDYTKHLRTHGFRYECSQCGEVLTQNGKLTFNLAVKTWERLYHCEHCGEAFALKGNLNVQANNLLKSYLYDQYEKTGSEKNSSGSHLSTQTEDNIQEQERTDCTEETDNTYSEIQVQERTQCREDTYQCDKCNKVFLTNGDLTDHLLAHKDIPYRSGQCCKAFERKIHWTRHLLTHSGEKPFQCCECDKAFAQKSNLTRHLRTHSGEKPYQCAQCNNSFARKRYLIQHLRTHSGEKPFQCSECDKAFTDKDSLKHHLKTHSGENPFQCHQCDKAFEQKDDLIKHVKCDCCVKNTADPGQILTEGPLDQETIKDGDVQEHKHREEIHWPDRRISTEPEIDKCSLFETRLSEATKKQELNSVVPSVCDVFAQVFLVCPHCQGLFISEEYLKRHLEKQYTTVTNISGPPATIAFAELGCEEEANQSDKCLPVQQHIDRNLHQCKLCDNVFLQRTSLDAHMLTHARTKSYYQSLPSYQCDQCGDVLAQKGDLILDQQEATWKKLFHCVQCDITFFQMGTLAVLTGNTLKLLQCGRTDSEQSSLTSHLSVHTENITQEKRRSDSIVETDHNYSKIQADDHKESHTCSLDYEPATTTVNETGGKNHQYNMWHETFTDKDNLESDGEQPGFPEDLDCDSPNTETSEKDKGPDLGNIGSFAHELLEDPNSGSITLTELECERETNQPGKLIHGNQLKKLHQCKFCSKSFAERKHFHAHMLIHRSKKPYQCDKCKKCFTLRNHLQMHMKTEHVYESVLVKTKYPSDNIVIRITRIKKPHKCNKCDKAFRWKSGLTIHLRTHSGGKPFQCKRCDKTFITPGTFTQHLRTHGGKKPFRCSKCDETFTQRYSLTLHRRRHRLLKPHACPQCGKTFARKSGITMHLKMHSGHKPHRCDQCDRTFALRGCFIKHLRTHSTEKEFQCGQCDKAFDEKHELDAHLSEHKVYECDQCNKIFARNSSLVNHLKMHIAEKPFECDLCDKAFMREDYLIAHRRIHTGEKSYKCTVCKKSFTRKDRFTRHMRIHRRKDYQCDHCGKGFLSQTKLVVHLRKLSRLNPYQCDQCDQEFSCKNGLTLHLRTHVSKGNQCQCTKCGKIFLSEFLLEMHIKRTHTKPRTSYISLHRKISFTGRSEPGHYQCLQCYKEFTNENEITAHLIAHFLKPNRYGCKKRDKAFSSEFFSKMHKRTRTKQRASHRSLQATGPFRKRSRGKPYQCDKCGKEFSCKFFLEMHIKRTHTSQTRPPRETTLTGHHSEPRDYQCLQCNKRFTYQSEIIAHLRAHFLQLNRYRCCECDKTFSSKFFLEMHNRTHTKQRVLSKHPRGKPYTCAKCGKEFDCKFFLNDHKKRTRAKRSLKTKNAITVPLRRHSRRRPYKCDQCDTSFGRKSKLTTHLRVHFLENNPYQCDQCNKAFKSKNKLNAHLRAHFLKDNPYRCSKCERAFSKKVSLILHRRTRHIK